MEDTWKVEFTDKNIIIIINEKYDDRYVFANNDETLDKFYEIKEELFDMEKRNWHYYVGDFIFSLPDIDFCGVDLFVDILDKCKLVCDSIELYEFERLLNKIVS